MEAAFWLVSLPPPQRIAILYLAAASTDPKSMPVTAFSGDFLASRGIRRFAEIQFAESAALQVFKRKRKNSVIDRESVADLIALKGRQVVAIKETSFPVVAIIADPRTSFLRHGKNLLQADHRPPRTVVGPHGGTAGGAWLFGRLAEIGCDVRAVRTYPPVLDRRCR